MYEELERNEGWKYSVCQTAIVCKYFIYIIEEAIWIKSYCLIWCSGHGSNSLCVWVCVWFDLSAGISCSDKDYNNNTVNAAESAH